MRKTKQQQQKQHNGFGCSYVQPVKRFLQRQLFSAIFSPIKPLFSAPAHPAKEKIVVIVFMIREEMGEQDIEII